MLKENFFFCHVNSTSLMSTSLQREHWWPKKLHFRNKSFLSLTSQKLLKQDCKFAYHVQNVLTDCDSWTNISGQTD